MRATKKKTIGRPPAPPLSLNPGFPRELLNLKYRLGAPFTLWPRVIEISIPTFRQIVEGGAPATFKARLTVARITAVLDIPLAHVTDLPLPRVPRELLLADLARLKKFGGTIFISQFCERRVAEIMAVPEDQS